MNIENANCVTDVSKYNDQNDHRNLSLLAYDRRFQMSFTNQPNATGKRLVHLWPNSASETIDRPDPTTSVVRRSRSQLRLRFGDLTQNLQHAIRPLEEEDFA